MLEDKKGYLSISYYDDYGSHVTVTQEYSPDRTWMEMIPQFNAFLHACQFVPRGHTFLEEVEPDVD